MTSIAQFARLLVIAAVAAVMFPQPARCGEPGNRPNVLRPALVIDDGGVIGGGGGGGGFQVGGGWYYFEYYSVACNSPIDCPGGSECASGVCEVTQGPFTFHSNAPVTVLVTDAWVNGDQFQVFDSGVSLGQTSVPGDDGRTSPYDACAGLIDPAWTLGKFTLGAGDHSITIKAIRFASGWTNGAGYVRADLGSLADSDKDGIPDICDLCVGPRSDSDGDGICDGADNCPFTSNPGQEDSHAGGAGDACEPPPNDQFADAVALTGGEMPYSDSFDNSGATLEPGEPQPCVPIGGTAWYKFAPHSDTTIEVDTSGSAVDTVLAAYTGSSLGDLVLVTCNDDSFGPGGPSQITLSVSAGQTVFIQAGGFGQVGGYRGNRGSLVLNLRSLSAACVGDCDSDGAVTIDELLTMVNIALGSANVSDCEGCDANSDGALTIDEILNGVNNALNGC